MMLKKMLLTFLAVSMFLFISAAQAEDTSGHALESALRSFALTVAAVIGLIWFLISRAKKRSVLHGKNGNENIEDKGVNEQ